MVQNFIWAFIYDQRYFFLALHPLPKGGGRFPLPLSSREAGLINVTWRWRGGGCVGRARSEPCDDAMTSQINVSVWATLPLPYPSPTPSGILLLINLDCHK
ncbi:hypothetical protein J6590_022649 [Homalodisca vitripennis]|nr:hypothetical protein J6590_022649 [Homalodisca vitripennis]